MDRRQTTLSRKILQAVRSYRPKEVYLFGSWARNEADDLSDIDIVVIKNTRLRFLDRLRKIRKLLTQSFSNVDVFVYTPAEFDRMKKEGNPFVETVLEEGVRIYDHGK